MSASGGREARMVEMTVAQLAVDPLTQSPVVVLRDRRGAATVPIRIGAVEASAIATELEQVQVERPTAHDLLKTILGECGVLVERVEVRRVKGDTFFAAIVLRNGEDVFEVDARPSDAIALALRTGAPIRVAQRVVDRARRQRASAVDGLERGLVADDEVPGRGGQGPAVDEPRGEAAAAGGAKVRVLELLFDDDFGKWKM